MTVDILIRTYHKDLNWLAHALRSIQMNVTGHRRVIVAIPNAGLLSHLTAETVVQVDDLTDGYIGQQLTKMEAWRYTDADAVLFWDSDTIATEPVNVSEWLKDGKPHIWKTRYSEIDTPWQGITEYAVGFPVEWEYMRRMPLLYRTSTLFNACEYMQGVHKKSMRDYLDSLPHRSFSEFNAIGAFAERFEADDYTFEDTNVADMPRNKCRQFWSWSGLDSKDLAEIKSYIG
jgi:hypothetical protein